MSPSNVVRVLQPVEGSVVSLQDVPDPVFSTQMLGPGLAIEPTGHTVASPGNGVLTLMYRTGHALVVTLDSGTQLLIHVGLDTVSLDGQGFTPLAEQGDRIEAGQPLLTFDPQVIRDAGHPITTMVVVMNEPSAVLEFKDGG